jgi:tetratricopeptide (TPR) repeat protein
MTKRKRKRKKQRRASALAPSDYRHNIRQADEALAYNNVEIRPDNWQRLALDWFAPNEPERSELARYIAEHEQSLGVTWARELLRMEIFVQAKDYLQIIDHYEQVSSRYPRCTLLEMYVADQIFRLAGDFWRARPMYRYAVEHFPEHPKPYYELGFMGFLLGDFPGALEWFNQAAERVVEYDAELGARVFYNRGVTRYIVEGDREAAIADVKQALKLKPDYPQAKEALFGLRGEVRWVPW